MTYRVYLCGGDPVPMGDGMERRFYYGVVPCDFNERTGRSKTHKSVRNPETQRDPTATTERRR